MAKHLPTLAVACSLAMTSQTSHAGVTVYKDDNGKYVKIGGRIQLQYHYTDPDNGASSDDLFFRRLRPYIEGSLHKDWKGKFQWDMGKSSADNELVVKDAYLQYKGFNNIKVTIGNANFPFSRELLTSSKYQQLTERTFVGDHNYGTPDRNLGIHLTGHGAAEIFTWGVSAASASIDPSSSKLDFDTPVNKNSDFNEGWIVGGRMDFHPFGILNYSQGDFDGDTKATIGLAAFTWRNDNDVSGHTADIDSVTGYEISSAIRAHGFSVDAQYNRFDADTSDNTFTSGLYRNGETRLNNWSVEGGYMIAPNKLEIVLGYSSQDADNYAIEWKRTEIGANWFLRKHDIKVQLSYRKNDNIDGSIGNDANEIFLQTQYVF